MSGNTQIGRLLATRFAPFDGTPHSEGRVVFWHDEVGEFSEEVDSIVGPEAENEALRDVELVRLERNPFALKYRIMLAEPTTKFLVYVEGKLPANEDNWLLDLEIAYGPWFTADKLSMILNELFPREASAETRRDWLAIMQRCKPFFDDDDLVQALQQRLRAEDDAKTFQAKMIASLLGLPVGEHSLQAIWRELLTQYAKDSARGIETIEAMGLADYHWAGTRGIYRFDSGNQLNKPTVKDFVIWLFRLAWNGFSDAENSIDYYANVRRDFDTWRNNPKTTPVIQRLASEVFPDLSLDSTIATMSLAELEQHDVFSEVDEQIVELLYEALDKTCSASSPPADTASGSPGSPMITTSSRPRARCVPCCGNASPLWSPSLRRKVDSRLIPIRSTKWTAVTGASSRRGKSVPHRGTGTSRTVWNGSTPGTSPSLASHGSGRSARWTVGRLRVYPPKPSSMRAM